MEKFDFAKNMAAFEREKEMRRKGLLRIREILYNYDGNFPAVACGDCKHFIPDTKTKTVYSVTGKCGAGKQAIIADHMHECEQFKLRQP